MRKLINKDLTNDKEAVLRDFDTRDLDAKPFKVTIIETLKLTVEIEAIDRHEAEQTISNSWHNSEYVLTADNFCGVEFRATDDSDDNAAKDELSIIWGKYLQYLRGWADSHSGPEFYGMNPACFEEWLGCEYSEDDDNVE